MNNKKSRISEELRMIEEENRFMEKINSDPEIANLTIPDEAYENLSREIRAYENAKAELEREMLSDEHMELLRLGTLYKKRRRWNKYIVLAAVLVLVMSLGITSMGGAEKIFEVFKRNILDREQVQVNSEGSVKPVEELNEEQAYEKIEDKFGFYPVKFIYLPEEISFLEAEIDEMIPRIYMLYGENQDVKISYIIRPNYKEGSWSKDIEDELLEEYEKEFEHTTVYVKKYLIENETVRWIIRFEYKGVNYSMYIFDEEKTEIEKIIEGLYFC